jgi:hypothetical protein
MPRLGRVEDEGIDLPYACDVPDVLVREAGRAEHDAPCHAVQRHHRQQRGQLVPRREEHASATQRLPAASQVCATGQTRDVGSGVQAVDQPPAPSTAVEDAAQEALVIP